MGAYGRKMSFFAVTFKICSNLQTVSEKKFCLGPKKTIGPKGYVFLLGPIDATARPETPFAPIGANAIAK